jgi:hypothetical protein
VPSSQVSLTAEEFPAVFHNRRIRRLVRKYPQVSRLSSADITERVLALKMELPGI